MVETSFISTPSANHGSGTRLSRPTAALQGAAGNTDLTGGHHQKLACGELVAMIREGSGKVIDLGLKIGAGKPEKQDAGMGKTLVEDQLAKIPIGNHENAPLLPGKRQDVLIRKAMGVVAGDCRNVMAKPAQVVNEAKV